MRCIFCAARPPASIAHPRCCWRQYSFASTGARYGLASIAPLLPSFASAPAAANAAHRHVCTRACAISLARSIIIVYCSTLAAADDSICVSIGARYGLAGIAPLFSSVGNTPAVANAHARRIARTASAHVLSVARPIIIGKCSNLAAADIVAAALVSTGAWCGLAGTAPLLASIASAPASCCKCASAVHRPNCTCARATSRAFPACPWRPHHGAPRHARKIATDAHRSHLHASTRLSSNLVLDAARNVPRTLSASSGTYATRASLQGRAAAHRCWRSCPPGRAVRQQVGGQPPNQGPRAHRREHAEVPAARRLHGLVHRPLHPTNECCGHAPAQIPRQGTAAATGCRIRTVRRHSTSAARAQRSLAATVLQSRTQDSAESTHFVFGAAWCTLQNLRHWSLSAVVSDD